jgi:hypothetical protein
VNSVHIGVLVLCLCASTACKNDRDDVRGDPSPPTNAAAGGATGAPSATAASVALDPSQGPLVAQLKAEIAKARSMSLKPYVEFRADWCDPCVALEKSMGDPRMVDAFAGTYVIHLDADAWGAKDLAGTGFHVNAIPVFFEIDDAGKPTGRSIDGGAWGENVPENMAPPLKKFFHPS